MNRHTFVYSIIGLVMVWVVCGALPLAAAGASNAPVGVTETPGNTPVPAATNTPVPVATNTSVPAPTNTPVPAATNTSVPVATNTPVPLPTSTPVRTHEHTDVPTPENTHVPTPADTPVSAPTVTPTAPVIVGFPNTGGGAPQDGSAIRILVMVAAVAGSLGALAFGLRIRSHRPTRR